MANFPWCQDTTNQTTHANSILKECSSNKVRYLSDNFFTKPKHNCNVLCLRDKERKFGTVLLANPLKRPLHKSATEHITFLPGYMLTLALIQTLSGRMLNPVHRTLSLIYVFLSSFLIKSLI